MNQNAIQALHAPDAAVRNEAALALGARPDADHAEALVEAMLAEPEAFTAESMIWAITANRPHTTPLLVEALNRPDVDSERILHALSKIQDPSTVPTIKLYVDDADPKVAAKAWWALARIADPETLPILVDHLGATDPFLREGLTRALVQWGPKSAEAVIAALASDDAAVRTHAIEVLIRLADPDARGTVARRDKVLAAGVEAAIQALTSTDAPEADETLRLMAADPDHTARAETARKILEARAARG